MLASRIFSLVFRLAEFVCAAIVLGIVSWFLHQRNKYGIGPLGRSIYTEVIAALSIPVSLIWMIPTKASMANHVADLFFSLAWFAAFGCLINWYYSINCGSIWYWEGIYLHGNYCGKWNAAQAFSFLSGIFWFASFLLGIFTYDKLRRNATVDGTTHGRRWGRSRV
jgi:hypothetical protein